MKHPPISAPAQPRQPRRRRRTYDDRATPLLPLPFAGEGWGGGACPSRPAIEKDRAILRVANSAAAGGTSESPLPDPPPQAGEGKAGAAAEGKDRRGCAAPLLPPAQVVEGEHRRSRAAPLLPLPLAGEGWGGGSCPSRRPIEKDRTILRVANSAAAGGTSESPLPDPPPQAGEGKAGAAAEGKDRCGRAAPLLPSAQAGEGEDRRSRAAPLLPLPLAGEGWGGGSCPSRRPIEKDRAILWVANSAAAGGTSESPLPDPPPQAGEGKADAAAEGKDRRSRAAPLLPSAQAGEGEDRRSRVAPLLPLAQAVEGNPGGAGEGKAGAAGEGKGICGADRSAPSVRDKAGAAHVATGAR